MSRVRSTISPRMAYALMTLTALFWAGNFVIGRGATEGIVPPLTLAWARWTGASLFLLPFVWQHLRTDWPRMRPHLPLIFALGAMGPGLFNTMQYVSLQSMTAVSGAVISSAGPILIALACWLILGERLRLIQSAGIVLSLAGVLYVVARGDITRLPPLGQSTGEIIMLLALLLWGIYTALLRYRPAIHNLSFAAATFVVASLVNAPLMVWELASGATLQLSAAAFFAVVYVAIFPGLLSYVFFNQAVDSIGGARASACFHLTPLFTAVLAAIFLSEPWHLYHAGGLALILGGIVMTSRSG